MSICATSPAVFAVETLEGRRHLSTTIWNKFGELAIVNKGAVSGAADINILRNGSTVAHGDQLVFSYDVDPTAKSDFRQALVIDTRGVMRLRHLDGGAAPGSEDPFGTSVKLPPGLIRQPGTAAGDFFLSARVTQVNLITDKASSGLLKLQLRGRPTNAVGQTAPVQMSWEVSLPRPSNKRAEVTLSSRATFTGRFALSASRAANAEAFRAAMFSSSNNTNKTLQYPAGTHDADRLRLLSAAGKQTLNMNLSAAARNQLLLPAGAGPRAGSALTGWMQLNQATPAPLNGDPPNISIVVLPDAAHAQYRAQAYINQDAGTDSNADNLGAWISRSFNGTTFAAGSQLQWTQRIVATDAVVSPGPLAAAKTPV